SSALQRLTSVSIGRGEPPPRLKSLGPHAAFRRRRNVRRRRRRPDGGAGGGVDDTRRTIPSTPRMYTLASAERGSSAIACQSSPPIGARCRTCCTLYITNNRNPPKKPVRMRNDARKKIW